MGIFARDTVGDAIDAITRFAGSTPGAKDAVAPAAASTADAVAETVATVVVKVAEATASIVSKVAQAAAQDAKPTATGVAFEADRVANIVYQYGPTHTTTATALPTGADYTWAFIYAHEGHPWAPNYRYAYIFWFVIAAIAITYAVSHHLRVSGGIVGAYFNRWGMRRKSVRYGKNKSFMLPSNSYLMLMAMVFVLILCLALVGPDHISSVNGVFGGTHKAAVHYKRAYDDMIDEIYATELIRPKHYDDINKSLWTAGNRFGYMSFAVMPLIVALALKSGPFGFFTPRWFTALHWDKVGTFHRAGGWFVWWLVTIHVTLWTTQLFIWHYDGRPMWVCMLIATRFRGAVTSYFFMTAAMFMSLRWVRDRVYELFYLSHVVFISLSFIFAIVHHHVIGYWIGACLVLWAGDRATRFTRTAYINGVFGTKTNRPSNPFHDKYEAEGGKAIVEIPEGYAQAQILPSKTIRLSIRTHRPMKWAPGQSLLLTLPELSNFQTHPFSIANNDPSEIVLLIKARKGLTLDLYNLCLERMRHSFKPANKRLSMLHKSAPVHIKARVDGPMGSAGRIPWTEYSNVLIVCGGSGVTFGMAICDYLSTVMNEPGYSGSTRRVRFVWIVREYAEITWAASALCRFRSALDRVKLEINIYVTNGAKSAPVDRQRKSAYDDANDDTSVDHSHDQLPAPGTYDPETGLTYDESDIRGLTNYYGEDDNNDAKDRRLSRLFQEEGRLRRMISRNEQEAIPEYPHFQGQPHGVSHAPLNIGRVNTARMQNQFRRYSTALQNVAHGHDHSITPPMSREDSQTTLAGGVALDDKKLDKHFLDHMHYKALTSRTQDMVLLENTPDAKGGSACLSCGNCEGDSLWIDEGDYMATKLMSENAHTGRPPLQTILKEEMANARGQTIIATCGPGGLNTSLRNLVSSSIDTAKIRSGDPSGYVTMYSEDFEM